MAPTVTNMVMGVQTNNTVKLGTYGQAEGACAELGLTKGGIEISNVRELYKKKADQYIGVLAVVKTSEEPTIKFSVSETTLDNMRLAWNLQAARLVGSVLSFGGDPVVTEMTLFLNVRAPGGNNRKMEFLKVVPSAAGTHSYKKEDETLIEFEFIVLQDTTATADEQMCIITDSGTDVTAPTVALTTPTDGNTVAKTTSDPVVWTISEEADENSVVYGDGDNCSFMLINTTTPGTADVEPGTIVYDATAKTVTFTPTVAWNASDTFQAIVTTVLRDRAGNHLAAIKIEQFSVTA